MNITQNNLTELSNYTEVWFRFDSNHTNVSSSILNRTQEDSEDTDKVTQITSLIFLAIIGLSLLTLVCCVCYLCCVECYDSHRRNYRTRYYYTSDSDYDNSSDSEADDNITYHTVIQSHTFSFEKTHKVTPKSKKIEETPVEKVIWGKENSVDNLTCSICLEKIDLDQEKVTQLSCQHIYHQDCISTWYFGGVTSVQSCPLCRTTMDHIVIQMDTI